jgi:hypothetical protein
VGHHLREQKPGADALSFSILAPELYAALLAVEMRAAAFLPCRVAACVSDGNVTLEAVSPVTIGQILNRPDLAALAIPLEDLLRAIMEEAAKPEAAVAARAAVFVHQGGLGATEEQMSTRGALPQRIDAHGTKVEELAGTGQHDAQGG